MEILKKVPSLSRDAFTTVHHFKNVLCKQAFFLGNHILYNISGIQLSLEDFSGCKMFAFPSLSNESIVRLLTRVCLILGDVFIYHVQELSICYLKHRVKSCDF